MTFPDFCKYRTIFITRIGKVCDEATHFQHFDAVVSSCFCDCDSQPLADNQDDKDGPDEISGVELRRLRDKAMKCESPRARDPASPAGKTYSYLVHLLGSGTSKLTDT